MTAILTDPHLKQAFCDITEQANVSCIIETGTNEGEGTLALHELVQFVVTCEVNDALADVAQAKFKGKNINLCRGSSDDIIARDLRYLIEKQKHRVMLVLDAHWNDHWPLLGELEAINKVRELGHKLTILIDDFRVPDTPNFWFCRDGRNDRPDGIVCGDNEPFDTELEKFPHVFYPNYSDINTIGYGIFSDFNLDLGPNFRKAR